MSVLGDWRNGGKGEKWTEGEGYRKTQETEDRMKQHKKDKRIPNTRQ